MASPRWIALVVAASASLAMLPTTARAAADRALPQRPPTNPAEAEFYVTPLSRELTGSTGQLLPFEFQVQVNGSALAVMVEPVKLRQDETGAIAVDTPAAPPTGLELQTPGRLIVHPTSPASIRGRVVVQSDSPLRSYGILVTELGPPDAPGATTPPGSPAVGVGVRFITRYLLRLDVHAPGLTHERLRELRIEDGGVRAREGRAIVGARILNPTTDAFEFEATCTLFRHDGRQVGKPFPLVMPIRANTAAEAERRRCRSFPQSVVRIEDRVPEPLPPGAYRARIEVRSGRERVMNECAFEVAPGDFPAQDRLLPRIVAAVEATPPRLELSLRAGGARIGAMMLTNTSDQPVDVSLVPEPYAGQDASWLRVQPERLALAAGGKRTVRIVPAITGNVDDDRYATLRLRVTPQDGSTGGEQSFPVVLRGRADAPVSFTVGDLRLERDAAAWSFALPVANTGPRHLELQARLAVLDAFGRPVEELTAGYGDWVLPGAEPCDLRLHLPRPLPPGDYVLKGTVQAGGGAAPVTIDQRWHVGPAMEERP